MKLDLLKEYPYFVPIIESVGVNINNANQSDFEHKADAEMLEDYWKNLPIGTKFKNEKGKTVAIVTRHKWGIVEIAFLFPKKLTWNTAIKKMNVFDDEIFPLLPNALKNINPELFHWDVGFLSDYEYREYPDVKNNVLKLFDIKERNDFYKTSYWLSATGMHNPYNAMTTHNSLFGEHRSNYNRCVYFLHLQKNQY